jgi:tetratricopeptide (TPR) repeat protein
MYNIDNELDSNIEKEIKRDIISIFNDLDENENDQEKVLPLLNDLIKKVNEICSIYYTYDDYDNILELYKKVSDRCIMIKENFKRSPVVTPSFLLKAFELSEYWKSRILGIKKNLAKINLIDGNASFLEGKYEMAITFFKKAQKYERNNIVLLNKLGISFFYLKEFEEAKNYLENALKLNESHINTIYNLALTYEQLNESEKAIGSYKKVIDIEPKHFAALASLGILFYKKEDYSNSKKYLESALKLRVNDWRINLAMGCTLSEGRWKDYSRAKRYFDKSSKFNPNSVLIKLNLSQNLLLLGRYEDSEKLLRDILYKIKDIEDRSTSIVTRILLICNLYLSKQENSIELVTLIQELIHYCNLKDFKWVDWNFKNPKEYINKSLNSNNEVDNTLNSIISLLDYKSANEKDIHLQQIQDFIINMSKPFSKISKINNSYREKIKINIKSEKILSKSKLYYENLQWYKWNISIDVLDISSQISHVIYKFDPTFRNNSQRIDTKNDINFNIKVIGWRESKVEINIILNDNSIIKKYATLEINKIS